MKKIIVLMLICIASFLFSLSQNYYLEILCRPEEKNCLKTLIEKQPWCEKDKVVTNSSSLLIGPYDLANAENVKKILEQELNLSCNILPMMLDSNDLINEVFETNNTDEEFVLQESSFTKEVTQEMINTYTDEMVIKIIKTALQLYTVPYKWGGSSLEKGIDCSFFVKYVFSELGINLPRTSQEQYRVGKPVSKEELRCGDLVFFKKSRYRKVKGKIRKYEYINHVGIYLVNNEFIHATRGSKKVTISSLEEPYFKKHFAGARRVIENGL